MTVGRKITELKCLIDFGNGRVLFKYGKKDSHIEKDCAINKLLTVALSCRKCLEYNRFSICSMAESVEYLK